MMMNFTFEVITYIYLEESQNFRQIALQLFNGRMEREREREGMREFVGERNNGKRSQKSDERDKTKLIIIFIIDNQRLPTTFQIPN